MFRAWTPVDCRATRDIDFLAFVRNSPSEVENAIRRIIATEVPDDGVDYVPDSIKTQPIKVGAVYEGIRVRLAALLHGARIPVRIDVAFGDVVFPIANRGEFPTLLGHPPPVLRLYPPESVVAEKLETMIRFGRINTRMKDFFDVWRLSQQRSFDGRTLTKAIKLTLGNRQTDPVAFRKLADELLEARRPQEAWQAFLANSRLSGPEVFECTLDTLDAFVGPPIDALLNETGFHRQWLPGGPW